MYSSILSKIAIACLFTLSLINTAYATCCTKVYKDQKPCCRPAPHLHDGFYLGGQAGYDSFRIRQSLIGPGEFNIVTSATGWVGGLFFGYGKYFNNLYYLGGEIFGNYNGLDQTLASINNDNGDTATQKMQIKETFGLSILPGIQIFDNVLGYLRLGYDWTEFEATNSVNEVNSAGIVILSNKDSANSRQGGWNFGLGMETVLYENWNLRSEYNHIWYRSGTFNIFGINDDFSASDNQFMVGLVYHIC